MTVHADTMPVNGSSGNGQAGNQHAGNRQILSHHLAELRASGLTDETITVAHIFSVTDRYQLAELLNWNNCSGRMVPAIAFPFFGANGLTGYTRELNLMLRGWRKENAYKYESPRGRSNEIYVPPGTIATLADPTVALLITEGEKKALKATQEGFHTIGLVGPYGWKKSKTEELHPSMARIAWQGRDVFIVFDSDRETNPQIRDAESRLALQLQRHGANVRIVKFPPGPPAPMASRKKSGSTIFCSPMGSTHCGS